MVKRKTLIIGVVVLALPFMALAGMTIKSVMQHYGAAKAWHMEIASFDPNDLFDKHYSDYRNN